MHCWWRILSLLVKWQRGFRRPFVFACCFGFIRLFFLLFCYSSTSFLRFYFHLLLILIFFLGNLPSGDVGSRGLLPIDEAKISWIHVSTKQRIMHHALVLSSLQLDPPVIIELPLKGNIRFDFITKQNDINKMVIKYNAHRHLFMRNRYATKDIIAIAHKSQLQDYSDVKQNELTLKVLEQDFAQAGMILI